MQINEKDWKLFRQRVPEWQENYMDKLTKQYITLLSGTGQASEKFWQLEKQIKNDKKSPGVLIDMRRSTMYQNLMGLLADQVITLDDLAGFSDDLLEIMKHFLRIQERYEKCQAEGG